MGTVQVATSAALAALLLLAWRLRRRGKGSDSSFDVHVARRHLFTVKHDLSKAPDALQLWVADMELPSPAHIVDAIVERAREQTYGYTIQPATAWERAARWLVERQGWTHTPASDAFVFSANVVASLCNLLRAVTVEGDGVVVMVPSYAPLQECVSGCGRRLVLHSLPRDANGRYSMDLTKLKQTLSSDGVKVLLLISPHNPSGRVWTRYELTELAQVCAERNVLVVSDEIWADWKLTSSTHAAAAFVPFSSVARACRHVTLNAPTKTFNLAGLHASYLVIEDPKLRERYLAHVSPATLHFGSTFATTALLAAYDSGPSGAWLDAARAHVRANVAYLAAELTRLNLDGFVEVLPLEATYLIWLDCSALVHRLRLSPPAARLEAFMLDEARLCISPGSEFDPTGASDCFVRLNAACPRSTIELAALQLRQAIERRATTFERLHSTAISSQPWGSGITSNV